MAAAVDGRHCVRLLPALHASPVGPGRTWV